MSAQSIQEHPAYVQASKKATYYINQLDKELSKYPALNSLEQRTQVPKTAAVGGTVFLASILLLFNSFAQPISNLLGLALPAYLSFKAIETPQPHDDVQWLTYWVVFGAFGFVESLALPLVLYYVRWYFVWKSVFLLWLQLPAFRGAKTLYSAVKPRFPGLSTSTPPVVVPHTDATSSSISHE